MNRSSVEKPDTILNQLSKCIISIDVLLALKGLWKHVRFSVVFGNRGLILAMHLMFATAQPSRPTAKRRTSPARRSTMRGRGGEKAHVREGGRFALGPQDRRHGQTFFRMAARR